MISDCYIDKHLEKRFPVTTFPCKHDVFPLLTKIKCNINYLAVVGIPFDETIGNSAKAA